MSFQCSSCKAENVQKLSLVFHNGMSDINGNQNTVGVGLGRGGIGVGVAKSKIKGTQQTQLSKQASPPIKKRVIKKAFIHLVLLLVIPSIISGMTRSNAVLTMISFFGYLAFAIYNTYKAMQYNKNVFPELFSKWDCQFMCLTCGNIFIPTKEAATLTS